MASSYQWEHVASQLMEINSSPLTIYEIRLATSWQSFVVITFVQSWSVFLFFRSADIPNYPKAVYSICLDRIQLWAAQWANYYLKPKWQSCRPLSGLCLLKLWFCPHLTGLLREGYRSSLDGGMVQGVISKVLRCARETGILTWKYAVEDDWLKMIT